MLTLTLKPTRTAVCLAAAVLVLGSLSSTPVHAESPGPTPTSHTDTPRFFLLRGNDLARTRSDIQNHSAGNLAMAAYQDMVRDADRSLNKPIEAVTDKTVKSPSGDPHDYVSLSPYWWPNPDTEDGLPYVRRDGKINPERDKYDVSRFGDMTGAVRREAFAYFYTGNEKYAQDAAKRLRVWFVDPETRMNPSLRYAQFVPGEADGRHWGIVETGRLLWIPDALVMLDKSPAMTDNVRDGLHQWFDQYLDWLLTSEFGKTELNSPNNHGSWSANQAVLYARYVGRDDVARSILETIKPRIGDQINKDGKQPLELERTRSLHYTAYNLRALMDLARHGEDLGVDLWHYQAPDGGSIRAAVNFVAPYVAGEKDWPYKQIHDPDYESLAQTLRMAATGLDEPRLNQIIQQIRPKFEDDDKSSVWLDLLMPAQPQQAATADAGRR